MRSAALVAAVAALAATPALAAWSLTNFTASVAMGTACFDETRCVIAGGNNGVGPMVWKTSDGGKTFASQKHDQAMMFMDAAADMGDKMTSNVAGFLTTQFSNDTAQTFFKALAGSAGPCQSVEAIHGTTGAVGITGETLFWNGVGKSTDGGKHFTVHKVFSANSHMAARYGAFPSPMVHYVSAGSWPKNNADIPEGFVAISERLQMHPTTGELRVVNRKMRAPAATNSTNYNAAIAKTTDGGKTWTTQFSKTSPDGFYFNGIDCIDENTCIAVAEADSGAGAGSRIFRTTDGKTWTQVMFNAGPQFSLMATRWASKTEVWAAGGEMDSAFVGEFFHSTDAGKTFTKVPLQGVYATSLSFPSTSAGFATVITQMQTSGFAAFSA